MVDGGPDTAVERMNTNRSDVVAPATTELTTPEKRITNATTAIDKTESHSVRDVRVPRHNSRAPITESQT